MNDARGPRGRLPEELVRYGHRRSGGVLLAWLALAALASAGVARLQIETSTDSVLDRAAPEWNFYQEAQDRFGGDEILTAMIRAESPYAAAALDEVERLTRAFQAIPGVLRVDSLATVPVVRVDGEGTLHLDPILGGADRDDLARSEIGALLQADRIAPRLLVSEDGRSFSINLVLEQGAENYYATVLPEVERLLEGTDADVSGVPVFRTAADGRTRSELLLFIPSRWRWWERFWRSSSAPYGALSLPSP